MKNLIIYMIIYSFLLALSMVLLKIGVNQIGGFHIRGVNDIVQLALAVLKNPLILCGIIIMASTFFLWLFILSWLKLGHAFPLTAFTYVFVPLLTYFVLNEKLLLHNYAGIALIATGIFFLLYK